jgi:hypothetical protein
MNSNFYVYITQELVEQTEPGLRRAMRTAQPGSLAAGATAVSHGRGPLDA